MISVIVDNKKETVTYSSLIMVDSKPLSIKVTKLLYYAKPYHLNHKLSLPEDLIERKITLFEELFYWPLELYASEKRNHLLYNLIKESEYNKQTEKYYELQWEVLDVNFDKGNKNSIIIKDKKNWMALVSPPNTPGVERYDYITGDGCLHYNCKKDEYHGIEIFFDGKQKLLNCKSSS